MAPNTIFCALRGRLALAGNTWLLHTGHSVIPPTHLLTQGETPGADSWGEGAHVARRVVKVQRYKAARQGISSGGAT